MESLKPTPFKKFVIDTSNHRFPVILAEKLLTKERLFTTLKHVLKLEVAIVLTVVISLLISKTSIYAKYIKNVEPAVIKLGSIKIKTRKLITMLIKYLLLTLIFTIIVFLI